jgi:hypothetical protein
LRRGGGAPKRWHSIAEIGDLVVCNLQTNVPKKAKGLSLGLGFLFFEYLGFGFVLKYRVNQIKQIYNNMT